MGGILYVGSRDALILIHGGSFYAFHLLSRYNDMPDKMAVYRRIGKRVLLLWVFGMMCQGNLLALDPDRVYLYSNTLQSIAMGYLIASLLFLHVRIRVQIGIAASLLLIFWGAMEFITVGNYGGGSYTPDSNLAEWIDRTVLGRFRDGATVENGEVIFATWYRYTWILSSLNFGGNRVDRVVRRIYPKEQIIFRAAQITDVIRYWSGYGYRRMALGYRASRY